MKKLYLVDVSSMFFRAYFAIRSLNNSKGVPTNAIYGFLSMVVKLLKDEQPDYLAFCYDRPEPSFRKEIFDDYKANRSEMPEDLAPQIPYIKKLTDVLGIPSFEEKGFEADDIIGTLAKFGEKNKMEVVIVSGDKDFSQLINKHITMFDTMKNNHFDVDKVIEKWGVHPDHFIDYQALTGDSSDNIPGVRGVGPKGAQKLINEFKTIENLYKNLDSVKNANLKKKLEESKESAFLSKELVTIKTDMKLPIKADDLKVKSVNREELEAVLDELEFQSFKKNLLGESSNGSKAKKTEVEVTVKEEGVPFKALQYSIKPLERWLKSIKELWVLSFQREILLASGEHIVEYSGDEALLKGLFDKQKELEWKGYDLKLFWRHLELETSQKAKWDAHLAAYILNAGPIKSFREIYQKYVGGDLVEFPNGQHLYDANKELEKVLREKLKETKMDAVLDTIELPVVDVLAAMETKGVLLDTKFLEKESKDLAKDIERLEESIQQEAGEKFNVASPKQLSQILFEKLKLPAGKKTKTGYSTDTSVLEKLQAEYPIAQEILHYRELAKLKSTYVDALPALVNPKTKRLHTQFNQALTSTGRLSSINPNLQNIPIRTERGLRVRKAFVAAKGCSLVSADYSQIELRVLAHISKDKALREAFEKGQDIHSRAASEIFSVPIDDVPYELRRKAKAVNFGIAYGQGVYGLAESLQIPRGEAKEIIETYFDRFKGVKKYMETIVEIAREKGYVETLFGRRRYLPDINSKKHNIRAFAERAAINAPIQGTASDLMKMAMIELSYKYREFMLLQVHDEMIFELPDSKDLEKNMKNIKKIMESCVSLSVPLSVNVTSGKDWASL